MDRSRSVVRVESSGPSMSAVPVFLYDQNLACTESAMSEYSTTSQCLSALLSRPGRVKFVPGGLRCKKKNQRTCQSHTNTVARHCQSHTTGDLAPLGVDNFLSPKFTRVSSDDFFLQSSKSSTSDPLRVEFLLKTDSGYPRDAGIFFHSRWQTLGVPSALTLIGQLHQSPPSPVPRDLGRCPSHQSHVTRAQRDIWTGPGP